MGRCSSPTRPGLFRLVLPNTHRKTVMVLRRRAIRTRGRAYEIILDILLLQLDRVELCAARRHGSKPGRAGWDSLRLCQLRTALVAAAGRRRKGSPGDSGRCG